VEYNLNGKTIALLATDGFEDSELTEPKNAIEQAGAEIRVISEGAGVITGKDGTEVSVDANIEDVEADEFDGLLLPGGVANPDIMRQNVQAINFVREFMESGKPVAAICHAPWLLIEADAVRGRTLTSWPSLKTDIINAGGDWVDEPVVTDNGLVTSRKPDDLPDFNAKAIEEFAEGIHARDT
jgi:protease I